MASFTEKINVIIDVSSQKASAGLKDFKTQVGEADGFTGKLKAGVGSLSSTFSAAAASPTVMAGAITAGAGAALKAASDFADLGVTIGKFRDATGLAAEDASRMVEVAEDLGLSSDTLQSTLGRLNKNIKPELFRDLGIEIATTADGATDVQGTFLNVIDRLNGMKDPAQKAATATKLLGKNWQEISEIIGMGSTGLAGRLAGVTGAKVMSDEDIKKAREFRDSMDNLKDVLENLVITLGSQVAPKIAELADTLAKVSGPMEHLSDSSDILGGGLNSITDGIDNISTAYDRFFGDDPPKKMESLGAASRQAGEYIDFLEGRVAANADAMDDTADATKRAYDATRKLRQAMEDLNDIQLDSLAAKTDLVTQTFELATAQGDYNDKVDEGKTSTAELAVEANNLAQEAADLAKKQGEVGGHTQTAAERTMTLMTEYDRMQSTLKKGSPLWNAIQAYKDQLLSIPTNIATSVSITGAGRGTANRPSAVTGGGGQTVDGERQTRAATVVNVNVRQLPTERELTDLINQTRRRQGPVI